MLLAFRTLLGVRLISVSSNAPLEPGETYQIHLEPNNAATRALMRVLPAALYAALLRYFSDLGHVELLEKRYLEAERLLVLRVRALERSAQGLALQGAPVLLVGGVAAGVLSIFGAWGLVASLRGLFREGGATVHAAVWVAVGAVVLLIFAPSAERAAKGLGGAP